MGYCMDQEDTQFRILAKNKHDAWKATRPLLKQSTAMGGALSNSGRVIQRHWSWVDMGEFQDAKTIEGVLEAWRWDAEVDPATDDIVGLQFRGEKLGDDTQLFRAIAPFVETGSFINMHGEDGATWTWKFSNGTFVG